MGVIDDGLQRAEQQVFTRQPPKSDAARVRLLLRQEQGSTKLLAQNLGVSQRTVQRWLKGTQHPNPQVSARIGARVRAGWQPRVRARLRRTAEAGGFTLHSRARFGYRSAAGSSDDPRLRLITQHLPGDVAAALFAARDAGAGEAAQAQILASGLQQHYFRDGGNRASGLAVEFNGIQFVDIGVWPMFSRHH